MLADLFHNKNLLNEALSLSHHGQSAPYERLEFLGDRVLGVIVADMLYHTFPKEKEGDLARRFVSMVREETLAEVALKIGLPDLLKTKENELRHNPSILADVCEAVLGALYLDSGLEAVRSFMTPLFKPLMQVNKKAPKDAKSTLQEWAQQHGFCLPIYTLLKKTGEDHNPYFYMQVEIMGTGLGTGEGPSKKAAEQQAAENLIKQLDNKS